MAYDKKHIKDANKQGLFDSSLDPSVLAMDSAEKKDLAEKLKRNVQEEGAGADAIPVESENKEKKSHPEANLSLWERVLLFIEKIFMGVSKEDFVKSRELRRVAAVAKHFKPQLINPANNRLTPQFCEMVYKLAVQMAGFKKIYKSCMEYDPKPGSDIRSFPGYFVEHMVEDFEDLFKKLNYSYINTNRGRFVDKNFRETIDNEINKFLSAIPHDDRRLINLYYANLVSFERLGDFNYIGLLRKFGDQYSDLSMAYPEFSSLSGDVVLFELQQLEKLFYSIDFSLDMVRPFSLLFEYYNLVYGEEVEKDWTMEDFKKMVDTVQAFLHGEKLVTILRLLSGSPYHIPKVRSRQMSLIDEYRQELSSKLAPYCRALLHQVEVDALNVKIKALFGSTVLSTIEFYNEATNKHLAELELPVFDNCSYLQIIKTYYERLFEPLIKPALNVVVVDGDFFDKGLYGKLSDFFYKFPEVYNEVTEFEKKIANSTKAGKQLQDLFRRIRSDLSSKKVVSDKIYYLNNLSAKAIRSVSGLLANSLPALKSLADDASKRPKPEFVLNIKQLGGIRNRAILKAVLKAVDATVLVSEIIKNFSQD